MPTTEETLIRANNVLAALEGLIAGDAAKTPIPDSSVSYSIPTPTFNAATGEWTLTQNTADTDGLYKGLYQLALSTGCSVLTIVSHNIVTPDDSIPARYAPCGGSLTSVAAVSNLTGQQISKVEFRSKNPFTVKVKLDDNIGSAPYRIWTWDFRTQGQGEFYIDATALPLKGGFVSGVGWRGVSSNNRVRFALLLEPSWRIRSIGVNIVTSGAGTVSRFLVIRPTAYSTTGQVTLNPANGTAGYTMCYHNANLLGYRELLIDASFSGTALVVVDKVAVIFYEAEAKLNSVFTEDESLCT
jgi:hypothetical protein